MEEKYLCNRISEEEKVKIIGIARHINERELRDWIENSGIFFTILNDMESKVTNSFGINRTPLKVLINNEGKILLVDPVRITSSKQEEFIKKLYKIIQ